MTIQDNFYRDHQTTKTEVTITMSLKESISEYKAGFIEKVPSDIRAVMGKATKALEASGLTNKAPKSGEAFPTFDLTNQNGQSRSLGDLLKQGPLVVTFYRGGWCPYCNLELKAYQDVLDEIQAAGASLVAITPELPDNSLSTSEKNDLSFEILTDTNSEFAKEIGIVFTLPEELRSIYENFGIHIEAHNGKGQFDLPLAATFVVTKDGKIASAFVDADYTVRQEPSEVIEVLKSI